MSISTDARPDNAGVSPGTMPIPAHLPTPALIHLIVGRFHDGHRRDLTELLRLSQRVESVHADHPDCPHGLNALLAQIWAELAPHQQKEEQVLFPLMMAGGSPLMAGPITCMVQEHDALAVQLDRLGSLANGFSPPDGACGTWRALYGTLAHFVAEAREHMRLENTVLFPRFAAVAVGAV